MRLYVLIAGWLLASLLGAAHAQEWPQKPVRILVPFGPGSPPDVAARLLADKMTASLGQSVFVENKPGAVGVVAMTELMRQPADGYNLLTMITPLLVAPVMIKGVTIDPIRDFAPVGQYTWSYSVLVSSPTAQTGTVRQLVDAVRANPKQFSFASGGHGTPAHLAGELFNQSYNIDAVHVPYNQFPLAIGDLSTGRVNYMFLTSTVAVPNVQTGKLKAIGVASAQRLPSLPNVPTLAEQGFTNFDIRAWDGFVVRQGTPQPVIERLHRALQAALATPEVKERFGFMGLDLVTGTPEQFGSLIKSDSERWINVVRKGNIKVE